MEERRQSLIAHAPFQMAWILKAVLGSFIVINLILVASFLLAGAGFDTPAQRVVLGLLVAAVEILTLGAVIILMRRLSNRIAGPIRRVGDVADALKQGDLTVRAAVRSDDYFSDELESLDDALQQLRERLAAAKQAGEGSDTPSELRDFLRWFQTD